MFTLLVIVYFCISVFLLLCELNMSEQLLPLLFKVLYSYVVIILTPLYNNILNILTLYYCFIL